jgi:hypothetical protein
MIENVAKKIGMNFFQTSSMYTWMQYFIFLIECKVTFLKFGGHQTDFIPSIWLGKVLNYQFSPKLIKYVFCDKHIK